MRPLTYAAINAIRTNFDHGTAESILFTVEYDATAEVWRFSAKGETRTVTPAGTLN